MFSLWLAGAAHVLGLFTIWTGDSRFVPWLLVGGYSAILVYLFRTALFWRDWFNPLSLILAVGLIRFSLPALLLMAGVDPEVEFPGWDALDFQAGHILAITGLLGTVLGWLLVSARSPGNHRLRMKLKPGVRLPAAGAMVVGFVALILFVAGNASLSDAILSGSFRATRIREGTGILFYLAHLLISGSVLLSAQGLRSRARSRYTVLLPAVLATLSLWILGGRGRALTPLICALLVMWYARRERQEWRQLSLTTVPAVVLIGLPLAAWAAHVGQLYRSGLGFRAFVESLSLSGLWAYVRTAVFTDVGHLYGLAGTVFVGPGVLAGKTFLYSLLWPISQALELAAKHPGVLVVEVLQGGVDRKWALATSVIGDAYLDFGIVGVSVVMVIFGILLKAAYVKFRRARLSLPIHVLSVVFALQIFYGSITAWSYAVVVLGSSLLLAGVGHALSGIPRHGHVTFKTTLTPIAALHGKSKN